MSLWTACTLYSRDGRRARYLIRVLLHRACTSLRSLAHGLLRNATHFSTAADLAAAAASLTMFLYVRAGFRLFDSMGTSHSGVTRARTVHTGTAARARSSSGTPRTSGLGLTRVRGLICLFAHIASTISVPQTLFSAAS